MNKYVFDSSAWIDYFLATSKGTKVREIVQQHPEIFTSGVVISEVCVKLLKEGGSTADMINAFRSLAKLIEYDFSIAEQAANIFVVQRKQKPKFGLADAHLVAIARRHDAKIVTCDNDFTGIPEAIIIK